MYKLLCWNSEQVKLAHILSILTLFLLEYVRNVGVLKALSPAIYKSTGYSTCQQISTVCSLELMQARTNAQPLSQGLSNLLLREQRQPSRLHFRLTVSSCLKGQQDSTLEKLLLKTVNKLN